MYTGSARGRSLSGLTVTLEQFRRTLTATEPPAGLMHALTGLWWDAKGDWTRAHESRSRTKASRVRGCMRISTARKATRAMPRIGTTAQASPFAESRWIRNG